MKPGTKKCEILYEKPRPGSMRRYSVGRDVALAHGRHHSRVPLVAIGVVSMVGRQKSQQSQHQIWRTWASSLPDHLVAVRFVLHAKAPYNSSAHVPWHPQPGMITWSDYEDEHRKTIDWFAKALGLFPNTPWISHADDDTYVNTHVLYHELSRILPPIKEAYGLMYCGDDWRHHKVSVPRQQYIGKAIEAYLDPVRQIGHVIKRKPSAEQLAEPQLKQYPFMQGGFYVLSRDLASLAIEEALRLWEAHSPLINWERVGEDAFVFLALHRAAAAANLTYRLRHLTWTRSHFLPAQPLTHKDGGMGWVFPSNSSSVVHWIKYGDMHLVHSVLRHTRRPAFAPFSFTWDARRQVLAHGRQMQLARWSIYRKCCWIFGCHAPYRGGQLDECFLNKTRDLSRPALRRIRFDFPFSSREYLGSPGFPIDGRPSSAA